MKAQPTTLASARARVNTVYPTAKRTTPYHHHTIQRNTNVSPKSLATASITKRRSSAYPSHSPTKQTPPQSRLSQQAHQRALVAQRNAAYAQRIAYRNTHLSTLDRSIRLLLDEEYREEIKAWMLEKEKLTMPNASAMDQQPELQWHMREHLLDFLLEIHLHFRLRPETLYLTLSILDRYVSRRIVYKKHYQLVGCVALWLAAKFEDAKERVPSVRDLKELCHNTYEEGAFVQMEGHVLGTVDWDLGHPTPESWLRILCTETHAVGLDACGMFGAQGALGLIQDQPFEDLRTQHVARFLMEMTLYSREYIQFVPSILALGALCLARHICGKSRRPQDESAEVLHVISFLDHTLSQTLDAVSQTLVKKYSYAHYSKASGVVVSFYLRGGRFPLHNVAATPVEVPQALEPMSVVLLVEPHLTYETSVPVTPIRERRMDSMVWASGRTDIEETPGLVSSTSADSSMTCSGDDSEFEQDLVEDEIDTPAEEVFGRPREHVVVEDDDEFDDEMDNGYFHQHRTSMLSVPSSDDMYPGDDSAPTSASMPITPTTPMFQLDPFGNAQAQQQQQAAQVQLPLPPHHASSKDKENVIPGVGHVVHHHHHHHHHHLNVPNHPQCDVIDVAEEIGGIEYRQALLAIGS